MKKYAMFMLAAILTIGLPISAQDGQRKQRSNDNRLHREMRMTAKERAEWMAKQLELTADQTEKVQALLEKQDDKRTEQITKLREQREQEITNRNKKREQIRALRENESKENRVELEGIIGKEKMEKLNTLRESRRQRSQADRQGKKAETSKI